MPVNGIDSTGSFRSSLESEKNFAICDKYQ